VSELNNPFPFLQAESVVADPSSPDRPNHRRPGHAPPAGAALDPINPYAEDPSWKGSDLFLAALVMMVALFVFTSISFGVGSLYLHRPVRELVNDPGALWIVPPTGLAYLAVMLFMSIRLARVRHAQFWRAVSWGWPKGLGGFGFLVLGAVTTVVLNLVARFLPIPKSLPVDRFFADRPSAYLMAFFGVLVAPLAEELIFRGFLYPVLDRWLQTLFMLPQRLRAGSLWISVIAGWGYLQHRTQAPWTQILTGLLLVGIAGIFLARSANSRQKPAYGVLLPGVSLLLWGHIAHLLPGRSSAYAAAGLLGLTLFGLVFAAAPPLRAWPASKIGRGLAMLITAAAFAMMHSDQLGGNWAALLILFAVSWVLTIARVVTGAVAPGVLIHMGYNGLLFFQLYAVSDHFRNLERLAQ
jgi:membrane protease YdiL (CAAX protease family)